MVVTPCGHERALEPHRPWMRLCSSDVAERVKLTAVVACDPAALCSNRMKPKRSAATVVFPEPGLASMKVRGLRTTTAVRCSSVSSGRGIVTYLGTHYDGMACIEELKELADVSRDANRMRRVLHRQSQRKRELSLRPTAGTFVEQRVNRHLI